MLQKGRRAVAEMGYSVSSRAESTARVAVTVTFLRIDRPPAEPVAELPPGTTIEPVPGCSVAFYRYLYDTVGAQYVWWLRRAAPDGRIAALLADPAVSIHVLYAAGEPQGFFELDRRGGPDVNLSYFGLMPQAVGQGLGFRFLRAAIAAGWDVPAGVPLPRGMTVNTCTADHPRALPTYLRAGFRPTRTVREMWDVPLRLGLAIPAHLHA
jgi:GNAT superfamily N-acetyltransferase